MIDACVWVCVGLVPWEGGGGCVCVGFRACGCGLILLSYPFPCVFALFYPLILSLYYLDDEFVSCIRDGVVDCGLSQVMERMDMELEESTVHKSFNTPKDKVIITNDLCSKIP